MGFKSCCFSFKNYKNSRHQIFNTGKLYNYVVLTGLVPILLHHIFRSGYVEFYSQILFIRIRISLGNLIIEKCKILNEISINCKLLFF